MRILMTTDTIGGVWTFTRELAEGLLRAGHSVALASFGRAPSSEQSTWAESTSSWSNMRFRYWPSSAPLEWMQENDRAVLYAMGMLLRLADEFKPDLLHCNQYCFGSLPLSIPKLVTAHSDVLSWAATCRPGGLDASEWLNRYRVLVQVGLDGADTLTAPTQFMLDAISSHYRVHCQANVIFNGRALSLKDEAPLRQRQAVSVGRLWDEAKSLATLCEINSPVPILIAGEQRFEEGSLCAVGPYVQLLGMLNEEKLIGLFRQSSVYIVTSLYEPFGLAPLEAALCGCAILARDLPSLREIWGDTVVYFKSAEELSVRLQQMFMSEDELRSWQNAAQQRAQTFTTERMTTCYVELYGELVSRVKTHGDAQEELASNAA